jgi:hypothetical protein
MTRGNRQRGWSDHAGCVCIARCMGWAVTPDSLAAAGWYLCWQLRKVWRASSQRQPYKVPSLQWVRPVTPVPHPLPHYPD